MICIRYTFFFQKNRPLHKNSEKTARRRAVLWILFCCHIMCDQSYGFTFSIQGFLITKILNLKMKLNLELYSNLELNLNLSLDLHRSSHKNSSKTARRRVVWWILLCCQGMSDQSYGATFFNQGFIPSRISDLKMSLNLELDANLELNLNLNLELNSRTCIAKEEAFYETFLLAHQL